MGHDFRWIGWNLEHITEHGVSREEAELVVRTARQPFPQELTDDKWLVQGRGNGGRFLQVIYLVGPDDRLFVIHARPLTDREKGRLRRRRR